MKIAFIILGVGAAAIIVLTTILLIRKKVIDKSTVGKYAFIYVGQLRTWKKSIPKWHATFARYHPDVFLFISPSDDHKIDTEEFQKVFGPHAKVKLVHYWTLEELAPFYDKNETFMNTKMEFARKHHWQYRDVRNEVHGGSITLIQFYQLQQVFTRWNFSEYDTVIKTRFDIVPDRKFNLIRSDVTRVFPHIKFLWKTFGGKDSYHKFGRVKSRRWIGECTTLGGEFVVQDDIAQMTDLEKHIWCINDLFYFSSSENMSKLHREIFDSYGKYMTSQIPMGFTPEANLLLHIRALGMQPMMVTKGVKLIRGV